VAVVGEGKTGNIRLTLPKPTRAALAGGVAAYPDPRPDAPLFVQLDPAALGAGRLTSQAVRLIVAGLGRRAGYPRSPAPTG
jgi:hypothetical protein